MLTIGSLFSEIGGLELGLEMAGVGHTVWQVEIDQWCRRVLAKHWPNAERYEDVREVGAHCLQRVDVLCGGFPCQNVSSAGKREGLAGARSGLWFEYLRIVSELHPRFVVVENVASGTKLWLPTVREGLEGLGYRVRAFALSAADVGAPHLRRRVFVVADADGAELRDEPGRSGGARRQGANVAPDDGSTWRAHGHADGEGEPALAEHGEMAGVCSVASGTSAWASPPEFCPLDDGVSTRLVGRRLKALGNAVVPQCSEVIGRILLELT